MIPMNTDQIPQLTEEQMSEIRASCSLLTALFYDDQERTKMRRTIPAILTKPGVPKIYALFDHREPLQIRYVGKTVNGLEKRWFCHIGDARRGESSCKAVWIRGLLNEGIYSGIKILSQEEDMTKLAIAERKWIRFWAQYCDLLNVRDGGPKKTQRFRSPIQLQM